LFVALVLTLYSTPTVAVPFIAMPAMPPCEFNVLLVQGVATEHVPELAPANTYPSNVVPDADPPNVASLGSANVPLALPVFVNVNVSTTRMAGVTF